MPKESPNRLEELWELTMGRGCIDREALTETVVALQGADLDFRSRNLLAESQLALSGHPVVDGHFPTLPSRLGQVMKKSTIEQYLRELGNKVQKPSRIIIGGSSALILKGLLLRNTEDIDLVDEVPKPIRDLHEWRAEAKQRYGLYIAHFQSHYLPTGWLGRLHSVGSFGKLEAHLVDPTDIFVGKLFSRREKDLDDLRALSDALSREKIDEILRGASDLWSDPGRSTQAKRNYYIVYGETIFEE